MEASRYNKQTYKNFNLKVDNRKKIIQKEEKASKDVINT